jgi:hypothetical protein
VLLGAGALGLSGCASGRSAPRAAQPPRSETGATAALVGRPQAAVLQLARGNSTTKFTISALPPPTHTWSVAIDAPAKADVEVHILTWYGAWLSVLDTTRERQSCAITGTQTHCLLSFPLLEAQRAGPWTVIARKRTDPSATVRIQVTFNPTRTG